MNARPLLALLVALPLAFADDEAVLATPAPQLADLDPAIASALADTIAPTAAATAPVVLAEALARAPAGARRAAVQRIGRFSLTAARPAVRKLAADGADDLLAVELGCLRQLKPVPDDTAVARDALARSADAKAVAIAMLILGDLGDVDSAARIIDRLADADAAVAGCARLSLEAISGRRLGTDAQAWRAWLRETQATAEAVLPRLTFQLSSQDPQVVAEAIVTLGALDEHRAEVGALLVPLCASADPHIATLARQTIERLGLPAPAETASRPASPTPTAPATALIASMRRSFGDRFVALMAIGLLVGSAGAILLLVILLRTREVVKRVTRRITGAVHRLSSRVARTARAARRRIKKITFTS